jgi:hypothetical protein
MTTMTMHGSASALEETPHATETPYTSETSTDTTTPVSTISTISDALRRRAQSVINDNSIDPRWRGIISYALEINDPWLADLVRRADAGEPIIDSVDFSLEPETLEDDPSEDKIGLFAGIICGTGDEAAAALFVLMGTLENSTHPKLLANAAKHFAFTHCAESNLFGMVDAQIAVVGGELLAGNMRIS